MPGLRQYGAQLGLGVAIGLATVYVLNNGRIGVPLAMSVLVGTLMLLLTLLRPLDGLFIYIQGCAFNAIWLGGFANLNRLLAPPLAFGWILYRFSVGDSEGNGFWRWRREPFVLLAGYAVLSTLWAFDRSAAMTRLVAVIFSVLLFVMTVDLARTPSQVRFVTCAVITMGVLIGFTGFWAYFGFDWDRYVLPEFRSKTYTPSGIFRLEGAVADPNEACLEMLAALALLWFVVACRAQINRGLLSFPLGTLLIACLLTFSRGGMLSLALLALLLWYRQPVEKRQALKVRAIPVIILLLLVFAARPSIFIPTLETVGSLRYVPAAFAGRLPVGIDTSIVGRFELVVLTTQVLGEHPLLGIGIGNLGYYFAATNLWPYEAAHNMYLGVAAQLGLIGLGLYLYAIYAAIRDSIRAERACAPEGEQAWLLFTTRTAMIVFLFGATFLSLEFHRVLWILFGLTRAATLAVGRRGREQHSVSSALTSGSGCLG